MLHSGIHIVTYKLFACCPPYFEYCVLLMHIMPVLSPRSLTSTMPAVHQRWLTATRERTCAAQKVFSQLVHKPWTAAR